MGDEDVLAEIGDGWIDQLENDLQEVEDIKRSAKESRALRARMISAKGEAFFATISREAKKAADRLRFEFESQPTCFVVTRRAPTFARLHATFDIVAQGIKVIRARAGASRAIEATDFIDIRLDADNDLYLKSEGKRRLISEVLSSMFRAAFLPPDSTPKE
jgi:hypothetical protein